MCQGPLALAGSDLHRTDRGPRTLRPVPAPTHDRVMEQDSTTTGQAADVSEEPTSPYAEVHETHTGLVVLVGDKAHKAKKPVKTDFLDFSTVDRRERACTREVVANSRLAPESYLGVAHLSDPTGGPAEPVIVMRRYPDSRRLATLGRFGWPSLAAHPGPARPPSPIRSPIGLAPKSSLPTTCGESCNSAAR